MKFHIIQPVVVNQNSAVAGLRVEVQVQHLQVLEQDAALGLHDRLRQAGRAGRVEHPQRVVERDARRTSAARRRRSARPSSSSPRTTVAQRRHRARRSRRAPRSGRTRCRCSGSRDGEQHLRLDLREAVDHAARRRSRASSSTRRRPASAGQERRRGLRDVRHVGGDAVAALHAERAQPGRDPRASARAARPRSTRRPRAPRRRR